MSYVIEIKISLANVQRPLFIKVETRNCFRTRNPNDFLTFTMY